MLTAHGRRLFPRASENSLKLFRGYRMAGGNASGNKTKGSLVLLNDWTNKRNSPVDDRERLELFEQTVLPHLDAAYNLARWLAGNDHDAQDVAQEASLRAFRFFGSYRGVNARAWLLTIVRNTFYTWLRKNRPSEKMVEIDDETLDIEDGSANPE